MHDPLVVAFEIRRPWPSRSTPIFKGERWRFHGSHWTIAGRGLYWPSIVTVWHREPDGHDSGHVCKHYRRFQDDGGEWQGKVLHGWRFHVHHWRLQFPPLQALRRRLLTRCAWCGGRSRKGDVVNVSHTWDGLKSKWWKGERGLFHSDCSSIEVAHRACVCDDPLTDHDDYGRCALCDGYRGWGRTAEQIAHAAELKAIPVGKRASGGADDA
jgi:hypothetical protein